MFICFIRLKSWCTINYATKIWPENECQNMPPLMPKNDYSLKTNSCVDGIMNNKYYGISIITRK